MPATDYPVRDRIEASTVLVVDDDATICELIQFILADEGYRVLTAGNGQAALDVLDVEPVDLILLDMNMPVMDGRTFARNYRRQQPPWAPVVVVTAAQSAAQSAAEIGAGGHLNKPFELDELLLTVEQNRYPMQRRLDEVSPVIDASDTLLGVATIARDIGAPGQVEAQVQALADISGALNNAWLDPETALDSIVKYVSQVLGDGAVLRVTNDTGLELVAAHHRRAPAQSMLLSSLEKTVSEGQGVEGRVASSTTPVRISDVVAEDGSASSILGVRFAEYLETVGVVSLMVLPARVGERSVGTFMVLRDRTARPYTDADYAFAQAVAERVAVGLENARLFAAERHARADAEHAVRQLTHSIGLRDQVLLTVSHDMRNPLTAILTQAQILNRNAVRSGALPYSPLRRGLERIIEAAQAVSADLEELIDASLQQIGEPLVLLREPTNMVALAERVVGRWRVAAPERRFEFATCELDLVGMWDSRRLWRVLDNLLSNAAKYSHAGSMVRVGLRSAHSESGPLAVLEVQDEGIGIPADDLPHVFEWFRRGMNVAQIGGAGIGLASAAGVVAQHGGSLRVESQQGRGSTFVLQLPLGAPLMDTPEEPRRAVNPPEETAERIPLQAA